MCACVHMWKETALMKTGFNNQRHLDTGLNCLPVKKGGGQQASNSPLYRAVRVFTTYAAFTFTESLSRHGGWVLVGENNRKVQVFKKLA